MNRKTNRKFALKGPKDMFKKISVIICCLCLMITLVGCSEKYNEKDIIGKSSNEIISAYGEFDNVIGIDVPDENRVYRNCKCGYTVEKSKQGFLSSSDEILFYIHFDENGIATDCEKGPRIGG